MDKKCESKRTNRKQRTGIDPSAKHQSSTKSGSLHASINVPTQGIIMKQMGRPRKKRRDEETQSSATEQWGFGEGVQDMSSSSAQTDSTMTSPYADLLAPQLSPTMYSGFSGMGESSGNSIGYDFSGMNATYMSAPQASSTLYGMSPPTVGLDYCQDFNNRAFLPNAQPWTSSPPTQFSPITQPNNFSPVQSHVPIPDQLPTPPSTTFDLTSPTSSGSCNCIPTIYKTLSEFPPSVAAPSFPATLVPLKRVINVALGCLSCSLCGLTYNSALQNSMGLMTLLHLSVVTYRTLLHNIDVQAHGMGDRKISYRMGELQDHPASSHLHTGTNDCPMGMSVDLSGTEWRTLARKAVKQDIWGRTKDQADTMVQVLKEMAARQRIWHGQFANDSPHHAHNHQQIPNLGGQQGSNCICIQAQQIDKLKREVDELRL
ncbi:uncharacterized protein KY384_006144 [Bacidia gigantensis]|uniref:uncharacterized protein n=1 Tax=Bacidia gigantensis TaxID=2732470 RepID=UPI001D057A3D|nr:uncharacterized protein KY384_006144 [Bacidia gigantensis]KAG8529507.1 hypothetical protein KY384_006144 [Bacidia gigantensis]